MQHVVPRDALTKAVMVIIPENGQCLRYEGAKMRVLCETRKTLTFGDIHLYYELLSLVLSKLVIDLKVTIKVVSRSNWNKDVPEYRLGVCFIYQGQLGVITWSSQGKKSGAFNSSQQIYKFTKLKNEIQKSLKSKELKN